jgi:8-oxo-dGTP pyrophosphatase MutT (NUDIX family)
MSKIVYVLNHVVSLDKKRAVILKKMRGPQFLIGKMTMPGGKIDPGEDIFEAASREMKEETNLDISKEDWILFEIFETDEYILNKLVAVTEHIDNAKQLEEEPVLVINLNEQVKDARKNPNNYTQDFIINIEKSLAALN